MTSTINGIVNVSLSILAIGTITILAVMLLIVLYCELRTYVTKKRHEWKITKYRYDDISDNYYYGKQSKLEDEEWKNYTE